MGGAGSDTITVLAAGNYTHSGDNVIFGDSGEVNPALAQTMEEADGGPDVITIGAAAGGDNTILGGAGSDTITVSGAGDNSILGDMGLVVAVNGVTPDLYGRDTAIGGGDTIALTAGADGNNVVMGEAGDDVITSSGNGLNVLLGDTADVIHQQIGDRLYPVLVTSTDIGIGGNDTITATQGTNVMVGGTGADTLIGGSGNDYILGDDGVVQFTPDVAHTSTPVTMYSTHFEDGGNDVINTGDGAYNYAIGGTGADTIVGGSGADLMAGDQALINWYNDGARQYFTTVESYPTISANDTIIGNGGNNDILGGEGADYLYGGPASNIIMGDGGHIYFQRNTEVVAETLNQFSPGADTIIGGGEGHNFLFGGGPQNNLFVADPLNDVIYNTDGRVVITAQRTGQWSMPPFLGNPVTSMVGNWLPGVIEGYVGGLDMIMANEYYTEPTVIGRLIGIDMMKVPAGATEIVPFHHTTPEPVLIVNEIMFGGIPVSPDHALSVQDADAVLLLDEALGLDATPVSDIEVPAPQAFIFDDNSGFWVVDSADPDAITLDLGDGAAPVQLDWQDDRLAA
jgi:Ca2+-binding RTX toxin-like protein